MPLLLSIPAIEDVFEHEFEGIGCGAGDAIEGVLHHACLAGVDELIGSDGAGHGMYPAGKAAVAGDGLRPQRISAGAVER